VVAVRKIKTANTTDVITNLAFIFSTYIWIGDNGIYFHMAVEIIAVTGPYAVGLRSHSLAKANPERINTVFNSLYIHP